MLGDGFFNIKAKSLSLSEWGAWAEVLFTKGDSCWKGLGTTALEYCGKLQTTTGRETQIIYLFDIHDVLLTLLTNQNSLKNAQAVDPLESKETDILDRRDSWCESIMKELICVIVEKPSVNRGGHLQQHPLYSLPQKLSFRSFPKDPPRDLLSYQQLCWLSLTSSSQMTEIVSQWHWVSHQTNICCKDTVALKWAQTPQTGGWLVGCLHLQTSRLF